MKLQYPCRALLQIKDGNGFMRRRMEQVLRPSPNESTRCCSFWENAFKPLTSERFTAQTDPPLGDKDRWWRVLALGQHSPCIHIKSTLSPPSVCVCFCCLDIDSVSIGYGSPLTLWPPAPFSAFEPHMWAAWAYPNPPPTTDPNHDSGCWSGCPVPRSLNTAVNSITQGIGARMFHNSTYNPQVLIVAGFRCYLAALWNIKILLWVVGLNKEGCLQWLQRRMMMKILSSNLFAPLKTF